MLADTIGLENPLRVRRGRGTKSRFLERTSNSEIIRVSSEITGVGEYEEVLFLQLMIPPKRFDIFFPLTEGCSEGLDALVQIFL